MLDAAQTQLRIDHFSHERFHDQFRDDLQRAGERVIIFSPFLAQNRANTYHDLLAGLAARGVAVDVYVKPKHEQPDSLQRQFDFVCHRLALAAVNLHLRPLMHEKIAIVDDAILWHGSLNILSHSDTRESMLRFESAALVEHLLADLGLAVDGVAEDATTQEIATATDAPTCPQCGKIMRLYNEASLLICTDSPACAGTLPVPSPEADGVVAVETLTVPCPLCGNPLQLRRSFASRLECSSASCPFSLDPRITRGVLRVLRQRHSQ